MPRVCRRLRPKRIVQARVPRHGWPLRPGPRAAPGPAPLFPAAMAAARAYAEFLAWRRPRCAHAPMRAWRKRCAQESLSRDEALAPGLALSVMRELPLALPQYPCAPAQGGGVPPRSPQQSRPTAQHNVGLHRLLGVAGAGAVAVAPSSIARRVIGVCVRWGVRRSDSVFSPDLQSSTKAVLGLTMQQDDPLKLFVGGLPWALTSDDLREVRSCTRVGAIACRVSSTYALPRLSLASKCHFGRCCRCRMRLWSVVSFRQQKRTPHALARVLTLPFTGFRRVRLHHRGQRGIRPRDWA
jgi:hypothetical protein